MPEQKLFGPMKLSGRALYDDGQMINSNVINHITKEPYLFDVLDVFVSHVATVSITFSCPLETLPLSFLLFAAHFCICCAFL